MFKLDQIFRNSFKLSKNVSIKHVSTTRQNIQVTDLINHKTTLEVVVSDGNFVKKAIKFNPLWLRFNCESEKSKSYYSGQIIINKNEIPIDLTIESAKMKDGNLLVVWDKNSNQDDSVLSLKSIVKSYLSDEKDFQMKSTDLRIKTSKELRYLDYQRFYDENGKHNNLEIFKWKRHIADYGICILSNVGIKENTVREVAELIAPITETIYGDLFEVKVQLNPINIAYSSAGLELHMDLVYYESPPGLQFLHCIEFDDAIKGGESTFLDSFEVAVKFREQYPKDFENLSRIPATFQKIHFNRDRPVCMVYHRPHIALNRHKQIIGVNWSPPFEGPLKSTDENDIKAYHESYIRFSRFLNTQPKLEYKLKPGEIACFNNRRILHGRREFTTDGFRYLQGCYVNIDEFKSEVLTNEYQIANQDDSSERIEASELELGKIAFGNNDLL